MRPIIVPTCIHGGDAGRLPNGQPRCPDCRRAAKHAADNARKVLTEAEQIVRYTDAKMRAAGDDTLWDE